MNDKTIDNTISIRPAEPKITREQLIENIKSWVVLDSQMKIINEKTRKIRENKHQLCESICQYMKEYNQLENKIGISDGELRIYEKKEYSPLSYGYLERSLGEIIPDKNQVNYIIQHLKNKREITTSLDIKRTYKN
jgi:predicted patatin/cPLA2 family phospholipase